MLAADFVTVTERTAVSVRSMPSRVGVRRRPLAAIGIVATVLLLGCAATLMAWRSVHRVADERDQRAADIASSSLAAVLVRTVSSLRGLDALGADGEVSSAEFSALSAGLLPESLFDALAYVEVVPEADRAAFEQRTGLELVDTDGRGGFVTSAARAEHLVVVSVAPVNESSSKLLGFDLASDVVRSTTVAASAVSGRPELSEPIRLASDAAPGVFVSQLISAPDGRVLGYVTSGISIAALLDAVSAADDPTEPVVSLSLGSTLVAGLAETSGGTASFEVGGKTFTVLADDTDDANLTLPWLAGAATLLLALVVGMSYRRDRRLTTVLARSLFTSDAIGDVARHLSAASTLSEVAGVMRTNAVAVVGARAVRVMMAIDDDELIPLANMVPLRRDVEATNEVHPQLQEVSRQALATDVHASGELTSVGESSSMVVALPLRLAPVSCDGALAFVMPGRPSRTQLAVMATLRDICAQTIARVTVTEVQARVAARNRGVVGLGERLAAADDVEAVMTVIADRAGAIVGATLTTAAHRLSVTDSELLVRSRSSDPLAADGIPTLIALDAVSPMGDCVRNGRTAVVSGRADLLHRYPGVDQDLAEHGIRSLICVPLSFRGGECAGAIGFYWNDRDGFTEDDHSAVSLIAELASRALERAVVGGLVQSGAARLSELTQALAAVASASEVIDVVARLVPPVLGARLALVSVAHGRPSSSLQFEHGLERSSDEMAASFYSIDLTESSPSVDAFNAAKPVYLEHRDRYLERYPHIDDALRHLDISAGAHVPVHDTSGLPIGVLTIVWSHPMLFHSTIRAVLATISDAIGQTLTRAALYDQEHELIVELQAALLAPVPEVPGLEIAVRYQPAVSVVGIGGDWYDAVVTPSGRFVAVIGDVTGHGAEAVATMAQLQAVIVHLLRIDTPGALVLSHASTMLATAGTYATAQIVEVDMGQGTLRYVNAGHPYPLLRRANGEVEVLSGGRRPLLGVDAPVQPDAECRFEPGDELLLYTDGLIERRRDSISDHIERLADLVRASVPGRPIADALDRLVRDARAVVPESEPPNDDDLAAMLIRHVGPARGDAAVVN